MADKTITIFGSSLPEEGDDEFTFAYMLGKKLAVNNFNVCTGGYGGIMRAVSKGAEENGAGVFGVTVTHWNSTPNEFLTQEIKCETLFERIHKLIELGDGFVVLQGGTGTLLELAYVWEMMNKKIIKKKPVACHSQMWEEIVQVMEKQIEKEGRETGLIKSCGSVDEIVAYISGELKAPGQN